MAHPKILVIPGSSRSQSVNAKLAAVVVKELALADVAVTRISLGDYPLPIYNGDDEAADGVPQNAIALKRLLLAQDGIFIASPEYNASVTPLLKNTIDWISRVRDDALPGRPFRDRVFALGAAAPGAYGGMRGLLALRQILTNGLGATVLPEQVLVARSAEAFDDQDRLTDERAVSSLQALVRRLIEEAGRYVDRF